MKTGLKGFSLIEIMIVMALIGLIMAGIAVAVFGQREKGQRMAAETEAAALNDLDEMVQILLEDYIEQGILANILEEHGFQLTGDIWEAPAIRMSADQVAEVSE